MNITNEVDLFAHIQSEIEKNQLILPTLPDVALRVRQALNDDGASAQKLTELIATDTALSARLIQVANSPLYRGRNEIKTLPLAINRLGNKTVKTLITSLAMRQIFKPRSKTLENYFKQSWEHSVNVSAISRALASRCKLLDPDQAMLGGLIYQIGKLPILMYAEKIPELINAPDALQKVLENLHPEIGKLIMRCWEFPDSLKPVVSEYLDYQRNPGPNADYVDVVQVAHLQSGVEFKSNGTHLSDIPSFSKLGLATEIEVLEIEGIAEEVQEAKSLFS